jgi:hypothetical protein
LAGSLVEDELGDRKAERSPEKLHSRISRGDGSVTAARASSEHQPRQDWDVVQWSDGNATMGAMRAGPDDAQVAREAVDDDVDEASPEASPNERKHPNLPEWRLGL